MSSTGVSVHALRVQYRAEKRSIDNTLREAGNLLKAKKESDLPRLDSELSEVMIRLKSLYNTCVELADNIDAGGKSDAEVHAEQDKLFVDYDKLYSTYREFKGQYVTLLHIVQEKKTKAERSHAPERQSVGLNASSFLDTNSVKVPRVQLKKFSGNRKEFHDWEGLFENVIVKDDRIDDVQKLYYLKTLLEGDAQKLVANVTYEASARNSTGCSLNDALMVGPVIQPDLFTCLVKFRRYPVAVTADISKMYRCIEVHEEDRDMQRILWRKNPSEPVQHYRLKTVTYGTSSAPFLATRCLQKIADDNSEQFPDAAESIRSKFYMDDWLSGGFSFEHALKRQQEVHSLLAKSHFPLVKYASNSGKLLSAIDNQHVGALKTVEFNPCDTISILGLKWLPENDTLAVKLNFNVDDLTTSPFTRRSTLSIVSKIFDPLGILSPVTITGKIIMQDIWREETDWDDPISPTSQLKVETYLKTLSSLSEFQLSRCYSSSYSESTRQLIGFSDASEHAYSAVLYLRSTNSNNQISSILIGAKTKVAPLKALTIPRMELCGTVLLAKLVLRVRKILEIELKNVYCFCDSTIALTWLRGPADKYHVFIRNRSLFVNSIVTATQWFHIHGDQNPADLCTRGITAAKFLQSMSFWNHGPEWLVSNFDTMLRRDVPTLQSVPELRKPATVAVMSYHKSYFERFSSFQRLIRSTAYMIRFIDRARGQLHTDLSVLSKEEVEQSTLRIIRLTQEFYYNKDYAALQQGKPLPARSCLLSLNAFLHSDGLIRVGGQLEHAALSFEQKHPIVLPRNCRIASLIVGDLHNRYYHANFSLLLSFVRSKWWIIGGVNKLVKSVIHNCILCTRLRSQIRHQIMADLPAARVQVSRPFSNTGVDYAGPLSVKCTNHRSTKHNKAYLAFFVCFSTKAVHIEVVSELTTEAFIFAFDRFIARRGVPAVMYSDNATNFVGFANLVTRDQLVNYATKNNFTWKFIPARSPHIGGLWEAAVKAGKKLLVKAVGQQVLTLKQLSTITARVEAILNSRPLCQNTSSELNYLTPAHFLVGSSLLEVPALETIVVSPCQRYKLLRQIVESFWVSWKQEYLHQLQVRSKWQNRSPNVQVDDIVILRDSNAPVLEWPIARITQVFLGDDGAVRSVELVCNGKLLTRSIRNLVTLPHSGS